MYCTKCGSLLAEDTSFCRSCGQAVPSGAVSQPAVTLEGVQSLSANPPLPAQYAAQAASASIPGPAQGAVSLPAPYAGFWLRFVAYLIDSAILTLAFGFMVAILIASVGLNFFRLIAPDMPDRFPNPLLPAALLGAIFLLLPVTIVGGWLYFALMEGSVHQGTLGKMALGLFVTDLRGSRVSFGRASGRFFAKIITGLIPLFLGYIMAGFTEKKQALHDMIASCLVLKKV